MKFIALICGGVGPNTWESDVSAEADTIQGALKLIEPQIEESGGQIVLIGQEDLMDMDG